VARYVTGHAAVDLAIFDQAMWSASRGHAAASTIVGGSLLADHFTPAFLVFVALYRLVATPIWMLVGQAAAAWAAVWILCRRTALSDRATAVLGAALLAAPPVSYALLSDVHPVVFAVPFALAALVSAERGSGTRTVVFGLVAACFRVEIGVATAVGAALLLPAAAPRRWWYLGVLGAGVAVALGLEQAWGAPGQWVVHYGQFGTSPVDALTHPWRFARVLRGENIVKVLPWVAVSGLVAPAGWRRAAPAVIAALPVVLSRWPGTGWWTEHYGLAPTLLYAFAWTPALRTRAGLVQRPVLGVVALAVAIGPLTPSVLFPVGGGYRTAVPPRSYAVSLWRPDTSVTCLTHGIPGSAGVSADMPAVSLLAQRAELYLWPDPFRPAPPSVLPGPLASAPSPARASRVDVVVAVRGQRPPAGFVVDATSSWGSRSHRAGVVLDPASCRS
jgi:hypothetical protein